MPVKVAAHGAAWYHPLLNVFSADSQQSNHSHIWGGVDLGCE